MQWRRLHRARGHVPPLLQIVGHGDGTMSRTANKTLTKLYGASRKRSPKRTYRTKKRRGTKNFFPALRARDVPPTFKFVLAPLFPFWPPSFQQVAEVVDWLVAAPHRRRRVIPGRWARSNKTPAAYQKKCMAIRHV